MVLTGAVSYFALLPFARLNNGPLFPVIEQISFLTPRNIENRKMKRKLLLVFICSALIFVAYSRSPQNPDVKLVRIPNGGIQPEAVADHGGEILHLIYFRGVPAHGDLLYVKSSDGGVTWSSALRVNSQPGTAIAAGTIRGGQIALGQNGAVHVAWNGSSEAESFGPMNPESGKRGAPMLYSRLNSSGTAFEPERNLMTHTFGLDGGGTVAADNSGNVYVAWHGKAVGAPEGEAGRQVWVTESRDGGKSFAAEQPAWKEPTGACGCCGMAMFTDARGTVRALYRSATENVHRDIYLIESQNRGERFTGRKLDTWQINACPMSSMAFAEAGGRILGAWETAGHVYFEDLTTPNALRIGATNEDKNSKHPRLAIMPDGETLMAWTEGTGWARGGSLAWQLFDRAGKPLGEKHTVAGVPTWSFAAVVPQAQGALILY